MANFRYDNDMLLKKEITGVGICEGGYLVIPARFVPVISEL